MNEQFSLRDLRTKLKNDPITKKMIQPSTKNAIFLDVDGDGAADFAFLCSDLKGDTLDAFAIDLSNDGDFDLYIYNCLNAEEAEIVMYPVDSDVPLELVPEGDAVENAAHLSEIPDLIRNFDTATFADYFRTMKKRIAEDYKKGNYYKG